jgi:2-hydroxychromene-2-carboxylate isomerase
MPATIDFYFDFSSPYGYLASERIEAIAAKHGRGVDWHPIMLGVIFKQTGAAPLTMIPLKGDYSRRDMARSARLNGIADFRMPSKFPIPSQAPARVVLWQKRQDEGIAVKLIHALYRAFFAVDLDISTPENTVAVAATCGIDATAARAAIDDPAIKELLKQENEKAMMRGVFGSPFIIVDGEPFWGMDRLDQVERWLATGGW